MSRSFPIATAAATAALMGCSVLTSMEGLSGAPGPAPHEEPADAAATTLRDARAPGPAASDASTARDAGALDGSATIGAFDAASPPLFYDDFESGPIPGAWDVVDTHRGSLSLDPSSFVSPHTSLGAFTQALLSGQTTSARLKKHFTAPASGTMVLETFIDVKRFDAANGSNAVLAELELLDAANDEYELQLDVQLDAQSGALGVTLNEHTALADGGSDLVVHAAPDPLPAGAWARVRIELRAAAPAFARLFIDGVSEIDVPATVTVPAPTTAQIVLGVSSAAAPSEPWTVEYDDAIYDVRP